MFIAYKLIASVGGIFAVLEVFLAYELIPSIGGIFAVVEAVSGPQVDSYCGWNFYCW